MGRGAIHIFSRLFWAALLVLILPGCRKNEFDVEFSLPAGVTRAYRVIYYASDPEKGWYTETAVDVRDGKARLKGVTRNPSLVFILGNSGTPGAVFYAERGDKISITGKNGDPTSWQVSGNDISERLSDFRTANLAALSDAGRLNKAVADYVKKNPGDPVSALLLMTSFDRRADEELFMRSLALLKGKAADPEWASLVGRSDFLEGKPTKPKVPGSFVVASRGGADTVSLSGKPAILLFTRTGSDRQQEAIETLRGVTREWKDSSQRRIVELNIEPDSTTRYSSVPYDSIRGAVRAWMPLGFSDPLAPALGVRSIPYARVSDARGKVIYQGSDLKRASDIFLKQKPK